MHDHQPSYRQGELLYHGLGYNRSNSTLHNENMI